MVVDLACLAAGELHVKLFFINRQARTRLQFAVTKEFQRDQLADLIQRGLPRIAFHILKGQEDHRISPLVGRVFFTALPNLLVLEIYGVVLIGLLEKDTKHIHIESFTKSTRTCEKSHLGFGVQEIPNE